MEFTKKRIKTWVCIVKMSKISKGLFSKFSVFFLQVTICKGKTYTIL